MGNYMPAVEVNNLVKERMIKHGVQRIKMQETFTEDMFCTVRSAVSESMGVILAGTYRIKPEYSSAKEQAKGHHRR